MAKESNEKGRRGLSDALKAKIEYHLDDWVGSDSDFARHLLNYYGGPSLNAWRNNVSRYRRFYGEPLERKTYEENELDTEQYVSEKSYYYNSETDVYVTFLRAAGGKPITVSGETHRAMKEAYSSMVGKPSTINQIAREFQFPRTWFDEYRRTHEWTHDMDPFTDEQIAENEVEDLVEDLVLRRRRVLHRTYEKKKWAEIQKDAEKWRNFEDSFLEHFNRLQLNTEPMVVSDAMLDLPETPIPYALVISPTDLHWGKYGWTDEVGTTYNFDEAKHRLVESSNDIMTRAVRCAGRMEKIILATGSDWFHVDNDGGTTTKGTAQDMAGTPAQILMSGCELARFHIDLLAQFAPVEVVFMAGNHDRYSTIALAMYLDAVYENNEHVSIKRTSASREYVSYGNTFMGFSHGDTVKQAKLPTVMADERWKEWGAHRFKMCFSGHLHHQQMKEVNGAMCILLPSLAGHDRYHARHGYNSLPGMSAYIVDIERGMIGSLFSPVIRYE